VDPTARAAIYQSVSQLYCAVAEILRSPASADTDQVVSNILGDAADLVELAAGQPQPSEPTPVPPPPPAPPAQTPPAPPPPAAPVGRVRPGRR